MIYTNRLAIIVPMYSSEISKNETISLFQAKKLLSDYDLIAVVPNDMEVNENYFTRIERFDRYFFTSVDTYNILMFSTEFYRRFQDYEYILIYQLDAFVFYDRLQYFCDLGYDYIGAPWLHGIFNYIDSSHYLWYVGNGGLSLRKVDSFIRLLEKKKPLLGEQIKNEDLFFSSIVDKDFHVAPKEIALQFSFERQVQKCFQLNQNRLPFGCHAWARYDLDFWRSYIEQYGYEVENIEKSGNEDITRAEEYVLWERFAQLISNKSGIERANNRFRDYLEPYDKSCIIFGAGFYGKGFSVWFNDIGIKVRYFCDNNIDLEGTKLNKISIIHSNSLIDRKEKSLIVIMNYQHEDEIAEQLRLMNLEPYKDYITFSDFVNLLE